MALSAKVKRYAYHMTLQIPLLAITSAHGHQEKKVKIFTAALFKIKMLEKVSIR